MNFCKNDKCSRCGGCCTPFLPMSKNEVKIIREYLKKHKDILEKAFNMPIFKDDNAIIRCCFYDPSEKKCMIYPVRPLICKLYKCNQSKLKIQKNKDFINKKAYYNNCDLKTITDFRDLFFNDKTLVILGLQHHLKFKNKEEMKQFCKENGLEGIVEFLENEEKKHS